MTELVQMIHLNCSELAKYASIINGKCYLKPDNQEKSMCSFFTHKDFKILVELLGNYDFRDYLNEEAFVAVNSQYLKIKEKFQIYYI